MEIPENRKNLLLLGGGVVLALLVLLLVVKMGHKSTPEAAPPGSSVIVTQPTPTPSPASHQKASALVFTGRNPFAPLTVASSSPNPSPSGSPTPAPSVSAAGSPAPGPGDGSSVTIGGHTVVLDDLFTSGGTGKAQVEVDGQVVADTGRDRGVLAVLDPRLRSKAYGARFLASFPPAPTVHDLSRIEAFFSD